MNPKGRMLEEWIDETNKNQKESLSRLLQEDEVEGVRYD